MPAGVSIEAFAVRMSSRRNTWRESAEMISVAMPADRSACATAIESPVLPVAVAPAITSSGGTVARRSVMERGGTPEGIRPRMLDSDVNEVADPARGPRQVDELVLAGAARQVDGLSPLPARGCIDALVAVTIAIVVLVCSRR